MGFALVAEPKRSNADQGSLNSQRPHLSIIHESSVSNPSDWCASLKIILKSLEKDEERVRFIDERRRVDVFTDGFIRFVFAVKQCVSKCCEKFLKHSARASVRFAELNQQSMQGMGGGPPGGA